MCFEKILNRRIIYPKITKVLSKWSELAGVFIDLKTDFWLPFLV
jgi:hypothetical protein